MVVRFLFLAILSFNLIEGQTPAADPRIALEDLVLALSDPGIASVSELREAIQRNGIQFDLGNDALSQILNAGVKGKRDNREVAALVTAAMAACQDCRARILTPMGPEELQTLLKRFTPEAVLREVRARSVTGLETTEATANVLRAWGAKEDLIAFLIPDDRIPTIPLLAPYKTAALKRALEYDPAADEGWLKITAELQANSQTEFIFKHNALFLKAVQGADPKDIQAFFNKPAPTKKTAEYVDFECGLETPAMVCGQEVRDEKKGGWVKSVLRKNGKTTTSLLEYSYVAPDGDGRAGFQIAVTNPEKTAQKYSIYLRWRVFDSPKPALPAPAVKR